MSPADPPELGSAIFQIRGPVDVQQATEVYRSASAHLSGKNGSSGPTLIIEVDGPLDLSVVDVLARLELMTRKHHAQLRIRVGAAGGTGGSAENETPADSLEQFPALLGYLGLAGVLAVRLEPRREAEPGK